MENLNITVADVNAGLKGYMRYSQSHNTDESIEALSLNERMAIITHYLHNQGTEFGKPYEEMAVKLMDDLYNWRIETAKIASKE